MKSLILQSSTRYLKIMLLIFSVYLLMRGHNSPGGGFVGGLLAASGFILYAMAFDVKAARKILKFDPEVFIAIGLLIAVGSGCLGLFYDLPFLTSQWGEIHLPILGELHLGTPVVFDLGVYLVVFGVIILIVFGIIEE